MYVLTSAGVGSLANIPWSSITYHHYRDKKLGLEVDYLFKSDMSGTYLSFKIFYFDELKEKYGESFDKYIEDESGSIRDFLKEKNLISDDFIFDVDLVKDGKYSKIFSTGTIVAKYYDSNNLPSDEEITNDLNRFLEIYEIVEKKYNGEFTQDYLEKSVTVGNMEEKTLKHDSFYEYLLNQGYLFDKETIENYLLSLKAKPFAILTGNSGTGKTKLSQLFAQYLIENYSLGPEKSSSINTEVLVGKSSESGGWSLNRNDIKDLIPIDELEDTYSIIVDGVPANANLKLNPRLFYKGNELKQHLAKLAEEDQTQKVPLKILLDEKSVIEKENYQNLLDVEPIIDDENSNGYITFKDKSRRKILGEDFFALGLKAVTALLGTYKYFYTVDVFIEGYKLINQTIYIQPYVRSHDKKLIKHLNDVENLKDVEIKINKKDFLNTFLDERDVEKNKKISFERKMNKWRAWHFPNSEWGNIIQIKKESSWRAIVDGIETTFDFGIRRVNLPAYIHDADERLNEILDKKGMDDYVKIEVDLSTLKRYEVDENFNLEEDFGFILINDNIDTNSNNVVYEDVKEEDSEKSNIQNNYKIIPVGANWTENRHIVGYYNVITNEYQSTPAYDLIKAANNSSEPHFLILDEMNLSHVERYFADFLSAIESGEKIPLYGEKELTLPENLFIIGTVNVDETTYMFSPKVLDRANVIEFETYSALDYMNNRINLDAPDGDISYLEDPLAGNYIRDYGIDELRYFFDGVTVDGDPFWNILTEEIFSFQKILKESGFDFGFRVINEIVRFMAVAWEYEYKPSEFSNWTRYYDACIKQKLLPKLHGSEKIIGETLDNLYSECVGEHLTYETSKYPQSARKLHEMREVLRKQRYVSFIN